MTYPPANRCSSVSFCAILLFFFFSNSHHLRVVPLLKLKERAERRFFFYDPSVLPCIYVYTSLAELSAMEWAELQGGLKSGSRWRQWAGRGCCLWRRNMCSPPRVLPFLVHVAQLLQATKLQKQPGNNTLNLWVAPDLHRFQYEIVAWLVNHAAHIHETYATHAYSHTCGLKGLYNQAKQNKTKHEISASKQN